MTITGYETFLDALTELDVESVLTKYKDPPTSIETASLPVMFTATNIGTVLTEEYMTVQTHGGWPHFTANLIIVMEAISQNTLPENHRATVKMVDQLTLALRTSPIGDIGKSDVSWTIQVVANLIFGQSQFWGVVATVEAHG